MHYTPSTVILDEGEMPGSLYGHNKTEEQWTVIQQSGDRYT